MLVSLTTAPSQALSSGCGNFLGCLCGRFPGVRPMLRAELSYSGPQRSLHQPPKIVKNY